MRKEAARRQEQEAKRLRRLNRNHSESQILPAQEASAPQEGASPAEV